MGADDAYGLVLPLAVLAFSFRGSAAARLADSQRDALRKKHTFSAVAG